MCPIFIFFKVRRVHLLLVLDTVPLIEIKGSFNTLQFTVETRSYSKDLRFQHQLCSLAVFYSSLGPHWLRPLNHRSLPP